VKRLLLTLLLASPLALVQLAAGCNAQGEGQLCSMLNNVSDDCATGLSCTSVPGSNATVCCSPNSTNTACVGVVATTTSVSSSNAAASSSSSSGGTGGAGTGGAMGTGGATGSGGTMADAGDGG
jgi:uncharacterized membrane protein YgcG